MKANNTAEQMCPLEAQAQKIYIRDFVSRQMFCKATKECLDERTAIIVEAHRDDKLISASVVSPSLESKLPQVKAKLEGMGFTVKFVTNNKKVQLPS
jgi:hypothetical protein